MMLYYSFKLKSEIRKLIIRRTLRIYLWYASYPFLLLAETKKNVKIDRDFFRSKSADIIVKQ